MSYNVKGRRGFSPKYSRKKTKNTPAKERFDPLALSFDAKDEIIKSYQIYIKELEESHTKLTSRINRLEVQHNEVMTPGILKLQAENVELKDALRDAEAAVHAERRLVSALHQDNSKLKLELLQTCQRLISLQIVSKVSDERIITLQGSDLVRQKLPNKLKELQRKLWAGADAASAKGVVNAEEVLMLRERVASLEAALAESEAQSKTERESLVQEKELSVRDLELKSIQLKEWVLRSQEKLAECQRECRLNTTHCVSLASEMQQQEKRHLHEREILLSAIAKLGGANKLKRELEELNISSSCLNAAAEHANATCQARELKLLSLNLQKELSQCQELLRESETRCAALLKEKNCLREGREDALQQIKKLRKKAVEEREVTSAQHERDVRRLKTELQGITSDLNCQQSDLKRLVNMIYKLTVWLSDSCPAGGCPPSPPQWADHPRAVATLARKLQAAQESTRGKLIALRKEADNKHKSGDESS